VGANKAVWDAPSLLLEAVIELDPGMLVFALTRENDQILRHEEQLHAAAVVAGETRGRNGE
jgi:hypothetical protein